MSRKPASSRAMAVARGEEPADLLVRGGRVLVPATKEWIQTDVAVADGVVAGWGARDALEVVDVDGAALTPGLIDAHMHLESTKLWVDQFVAAVLPHGTTAVAADPHEIANVLGVAGVAELASASARLPFTFGICASSCVPASPFESSGAELGPAEVASLMDDYGAIGVAEVMNFPGVVHGDPETMAKIASAGRRRVDGHAPGLSGRELDAYIAAGVESDHECTTLEEAEERRRKGMWVFIRQGSASQNLEALIPTVLRHGTDLVALCTDDREPDTIKEIGHMNDCVRLAMRHGVKDVDAFVMATWNPAVYHGFFQLGALSPGYQADILAFDQLSEVQPAMVWQQGRLLARAGRLLPGAVPLVPPSAVFRNTVHLDPVPTAQAFDAGLPSGVQVRAIGVIAGSLSTSQVIGAWDDPAHRMARLAVVERHRATGRVGLGFTTGFGLERGALASTVGHDAHNVMVIGSRCLEGPREMQAAVRRLAEMGGGQVAVLDGRVLAEVELPLAGLMSDRPVEEVAAKVSGLEKVVKDALGVSIPAPFMQLSFLGLSVIPELRLTDKGLVDVSAFQLTPLAVH